MFFNIKKIKYTKLLLIIYTVIINCFFAFRSYAEVSESLFFMGEDIQVVTVASGRPELPQNAPAIVDIVTSDYLTHEGALSLADVLQQRPGFYLAPNESGHKLYIRGVPSGALFLYDSIPLTTDSTKSIYPLDNALSLTALKRIEIIRGPASVLWGPDAFVGVINVVPKSGLDLDGLELGGIYSSLDNYKRVFLNYGKNAGLWNGFISLNGCWRQSKENKYLQKFYDVIYNFNINDTFNISGKYSYNSKPYITYYNFGLNKWNADNQQSLFLFKIQGKKNINDHTTITLENYINILNQQQEEEIFCLNQKDIVYALKLILNRELFDKHGLLTFGLSHRINQVKNANIQIRSFLPDYIENLDTYFQPLLNNASFVTRLSSIFFQYRHHLKKWDVWFGTRLDRHNEYHSTISYNIGLLKEYNNFYLKFVFGSAYRTPYASQFIGQHNLEPEQINSFNLEFNYHKYKKFSFSITPFYNIIHNHINEDPFGGYSQPNTQYILGLEANINYRLSSQLKLMLNTSLFNHWGDKEQYKILDYITMIPNRPPDEHYYIWSRNYDYGADKIFNFAIQYNINKYINLFFTTRYIGKVIQQYKDIEYSFKPYIVSDCNINIQNITPNLKTSISIKNLFNRKYKIPGRFTPIDGRPLQLFIKLTYLFK